MDLNNATNLLIDWFSEVDSFSLKNNYKQLNWKSFFDSKLDDDECRAAIELALQGLVENNVIKSIDRGSGKVRETVYIAINSLKNRPVTIELSKETSEKVATIVTNLLPFITLEKVEPIKARELSEQDIILLLECISLLNSQVQESLLEKQKAEDRKKQNPTEE
jgi:hypothetical protein